jgi:undecaprenyl-diphosphatase
MDRALVRDHRRALVWSAVLIAATIGLLLAVGRHPTAAAPETTVRFVGRFDQNIYDAIQPIQVAPLTWLAAFLSVLGSGLVTIPLRVLVSAYLAWRRWWHAFAAFVATWVVSEVALSRLKLFYERGRPPDPLISTSGFSFPSGHSVAGAAIAISLVLVLITAGPHRRRLEVLAGVFLVVMGMSRVYLNAHWFSDALAGVLVGSTAAILCTGVVTEVETRLAARRRRAGPAAIPP